jgi:hypothetical protein
MEDLFLVSNLAFFAVVISMKNQPSLALSSIRMVQGFLRYCRTA